MGGFFGVVSKEDCVLDVYFGTDYHSHLGTRRGGMAFWNDTGFKRSIHNIENIQFRAKFESELAKINGNMGIGCISDTDPQPLTVRSHLGHYAISTVGKINNLEELTDRAFTNQNIHFLETNKGSINPTELVSVIIDQENSFKAGLLKAQALIEGSCSILLLTPKGIYASRDKFGRTPLLVGKKEGSFCVAFESCTFANLGYKFENELGPGEIILMTPEGIEKISPPRDKMKICAFLWVYYGYPSSTYAGMNVEVMRYRNGAAMARNDDVDIDLVANKRLLFCDDSIVRGTQMRETVDLLYRCDAKEVHIRSACPPIVYGYKFLNFSSLKFQNIHDMIDAIGIGRENICTYCWNGQE